MGLIFLAQCDVVCPWSLMFCYLHGTLALSRCTFRFLAIHYQSFCIFFLFLSRMMTSRVRNAMLLVELLFTVPVLSLKYCRFGLHTQRDSSHCLKLNSPNAQALYWQLMRKPKEIVKSPKALKRSWNFWRLVSIYDCRDGVFILVSGTIPENLGFGQSDILN